MLSTNATLWPMIAHVALVFCLYWMLSKKRVAAVRSGRVEVAQFREDGNCGEAQRRRKPR